MKNRIIAVIAGIFIAGLSVCTPLIFGQTTEEQEEAFLIRFYEKAEELKKNWQIRFLPVDAGEGSLYIEDIILEPVHDERGNISFYTTALEIGKKLLNQPMVAVRSLRIHAINTLRSLEPSSLELEELLLRHLILVNTLNVWKWGYPTNALGPVPTLFFSRFEIAFTPLERTLQWKDPFSKPVVLFDYYPREKRLALKYASVRIDGMPGLSSMLLIPGAERVIAEEHLDALKTMIDFDNAAERFSQKAFDAIFAAPPSGN